MDPTLAADLDMRYYAYKLGYLSRIKIRTEACKAEPRLHKLLGHATLFDNARQYINDHLYDQEEQITEIETIADDDCDDLEFDDVPAFEYVEDVEDHDPCTPNANNIHPMWSLSSKETLDCVGAFNSSPITELVLTESHDGHDCSWDNDDSSGTEVDDEEDDGHWSDTTAEEEEEAHSVPVDSSSINASLRKDLEHTYPKPKSEDDDTVLWAQQSPVWSLRQVEALFVETFG